MKTLILNRFDLSGVRYPDRAGPRNELVLVTDERAMDPDPQIRHSQLEGYHETYAFHDYDDSPEVEDFCLTRFQRGEFDRLLAMSEIDILRAARIREHLGIPGQSVESAAAFRDKLTMKDLWRARGLPVADHASAPNVSAIRAFSERIGRPFVIKPRRQAGSVGVTVIRSEDDLDAFIASTPELRGFDDSSLMCEEYIEHQLIHCDGIISDGRLAWSWTSRMTSTLGHHEGDPLRSVMLSRSDPLLHEVTDLVRAALECMPVPQFSLFQAEIFVNPSKGLALNEIASRMGGGKINTMLKSAFGHWTLDWHLRTALDRPQPLPKITPERLAGFTLIRPRPGIFGGAPDTCPVAGVDQYQVNHRKGDRLGNPRTSIDFLASFVVVGDGADDVNARLDACEAWFAGNSILD